MAEVIEFQTNIPQVVSLAYAQGKPLDSKIPGAPRNVLFTALDKRVFFLPEPAAEALKAAGIGARTPFELCKREIGKGKTQWQFKAINDAGEDRVLVAQLEKSVEMAQNAKRGSNGTGAPQTNAPAPQVVTTKRSSMIQQPHNTAPVVARLYTAAPPPDPAWSAPLPPEPEDTDYAPRDSAPAQPAITPLPQTTIKLCACLKSAIDAALEASAYAARLGWDLQFSGEDVRTMANTLAMNGGLK